MIKSLNKEIKRLKDSNKALLEYKHQNLELSMKLSKLQKQVQKTDKSTVTSRDLQKLNSRIELLEFFQRNEGKMILITPSLKSSL